MIRPTRCSIVSLVEYFGSSDGYGRRFGSESPAKSDEHPLPGGVTEIVFAAERGRVRTGREYNSVDAIIVGRGGMSDSNLQAFNTERVAEAIFTANTPIVNAIGHTDDQLIADRVADMAAITPTAAGEYIATSRNDFLASESGPLKQQLEAAYETFGQEHEHEQPTGPRQTS